MRKNGFTLIELLAVIVILAIIALIATPIILGIINDAREKTNERSVELYASAVRNGVAAYQLRTGNEVKADTYNESNPLPFEVEYDGKVDCTEIIISEDGKVSLDKCTVNGGTKEYSYGMEEETPVAKGTMGICNPISVQTEGFYTAGDKYECDVDPNKEGYDQIFYVLTTPASGATSVNLIMDSNIRAGGEAVKEKNPTEDQMGLVSWYENNEDNSQGPITAMDYLNDATSTWTNLNKMTVNIFTDCNYETCTEKLMSKTYNIYARLPYYSEISNVSSTDLYLIDYLEMSRNGVSGVLGYWTLSSFAEESHYAWFVYRDGYISDYYDQFASDVYGVRPVITLSI